MQRADEIVARDMKIIMILYGAIVQIICLFVPGDLARMSIGLWIGVISGIAMLIHIHDTLDEALELGEEGAQKYAQKRYAIRYCTVVIVFMVVSHLEIANIFTLIIGVMGLKISAYLQPIICKLRNRK